jgi:hypothetical protein
MSTKPSEHPLGSHLLIRDHFAKVTTTFSRRSQSIPTEQMGAFHFSGLSDGIIVSGTPFRRHDLIQVGLH